MTIRRALGRSVFGLVRLGFHTTGMVAPDLCGRAAARLFLRPRRRHRRYADDPSLGCVELLEARYEGRTLRGRAWGSGPVVLLVHGWETDWRSMAAFVPGLLERGFRVIAFDAPAHGESEGNQTNLVDYAGAIRAIADRAGPLHGIVAHSLGAPSVVVALAGWASPEGAPLRVNRLALVAPAADLSSALSRFGRLLSLPPRVLEIATRRIERELGRPARAFSVPAVAASQRTPLLVVHDVEDREIPYREGEAIAEAWPLAQLVTTRGHGHNRLLRDPGVVDRIGAFMGQGSTPGGGCCTRDPFEHSNGGTV